MTETETPDLDQQLRALGRALDRAAPAVEIDERSTTSLVAVGDPKSSWRAGSRLATVSVAAAVALVVAALALRHETTTSVTSDAPTVVTMTESSPAVGASIAQLSVPALGLDVEVREGVDKAELTQGPGHDPASAPIGAVGHSVIFGHRTTYGADFRDLDLLEPGDHIMLRTDAGTFDYVVRRQADGSGFRVVDPAALLPLSPSTTPLLSLVSYHPRYSSALRIVVDADLVTEGASPPSSG